MNVLSLWGLQTALRQSARLIANKSHIRVAGFAGNGGPGSIKPVVVDSLPCSGQGKIVHGLLIGVPAHG